MPAKKTKKAPARIACPNCFVRRAEPRSACVLEALMSIVVERGESSANRNMRIWSTVDPDRLWDALGPVVDRLAAGEFSSEPGPLTQIAERAEEDADV